MVLWPPAKQGHLRRGKKETERQKDTNVRNNLTLHMSNKNTEILTMGEESDLCDFRTYYLFSFFPIRSRGVTLILLFLGLREVFIWPELAHPSGCPPRCRRKPRPGFACFSLGNEFAPGERYSQNSWRKKSHVNSPNRLSSSSFDRVGFPSVCGDWPKGVCPRVQLSFGSAGLLRHRTESIYAVPSGTQDGPPK